MEKLKIKNSQSGFGMVQVMMAASVASVLSLGIANLITNQSQQISYMEDRMTHQNLKTEIENLVAGSAGSCSESVKGVRLPENNGEVDITLKDESGAVVFDPADKDKNSLDRVLIDRIFVRDVNVHSGGSGSGEVEIVVNPVRERKGGGASEMRPVVIKKDVKMDTATNSLTLCEGSTQADEEISCALRYMTEEETPQPDLYRSKEYKTNVIGPAASQSFRISNDVSVIRLSLGYSARSGEICDKDYSCPEQDLTYVIYPGKTKVGNFTFPKGGVLSVKNYYYGSYKHVSCSKSSSYYTRFYKKEYYYAGRKLATKYKKNNSKYSCGVITGHLNILKTNTMPVYCPIVSGRTTASIPNNLGFELYTNGVE